jgi:hypothetical protein
MAKLMNKRETPPTQWRYVEMETGYLFEGIDYEDLVRKVRVHRDYKGLPSDLATVQELVDTQLCLTLPDGVCRRGPGDIPQIEDRTHAISGVQIMNFNKALFTFLKEGMSFEEKEEAERRADVCAKCPLNKSLKQCSCSTFYKVVEKMIPEHRRDRRISVCAACGCSLQAKVNMPGSVLKASSDPALAFPEWCWQPEVLAKTDKL